MEPMRDAQKHGTPRCGTQKKCTQKESSKLIREANSQDEFTQWVIANC